MPDLYGNKTTRERELEVFIQVIIETWRDAIERASFEAFIRLQPTSG
jgi:hypothetical protein